MAELKNKSNLVYMRVRDCQIINSLEAIDYGVVTDEDLSNVGRLSLPYEELAVVRAGHDIFPGTAKKVGLLDVGGGVAVAAIPPVVIVAGQGGCRGRSGVAVAGMQ